MKKALSLILALVICLSLCACGGGNDTQGNSAESNPTESNPTESKVSLMDAPEADFCTIYEECKENIVSAKSKYVTKEYQFPAIVKETYEDCIRVAPMKFPSYPYGSWYYVTVYMPEDEIVKVSTQEIINVAGQLSDLEANSAEMKNGVVLDDSIAFRGEVSGFFLNEDWTKHIMEIKMTNGNKVIHLWLEVADADGAENITSATIDGVTVAVGDYISGTGKMEAFGAYTDRFSIVEILSVEKN